MNWAEEPPATRALGTTRGRYTEVRRWVGFHDTAGPGMWARALAFWGQHHAQATGPRLRGSLAVDEIPFHFVRR